MGQSWLDLASRQHDSIFEDRIVQTNNKIKNKKTNNQKKLLKIALNIRCENSKEEHKKNNIGLVPIQEHFQAVRFHTELPMAVCEKHTGTHQTDFQTLIFQHYTENQHYFISKGF